MLEMEEKKYSTPLRARKPTHMSEEILHPATETRRSEHTSARVTSHMQTIAEAAARNMRGKYPEPRAPEPKSIAFKNHRQSEPIVKVKPLEVKKEVHVKKPTVPRSLYYANGHVPKLADLRDAIRNNSMFHNRYNPHFGTSEFKKAYGPALRRAPHEAPGKIDEEWEDQNLVDLLIPYHQEAVDKRLERYLAEVNYQAVLHTHNQ